MQDRDSRTSSMLLVAGALLFSLWPSSHTSLVAQDAVKPAGEKVAKAAEPDPRAADRAAIQKTTLGFTNAFEKRDAAAAAAFMTSGAELIPHDGDPVRGRDAIQKLYTAHFLKNARPSLDLVAQSLDFPSRDTAIENGVMTITRVDDAAGKDDEDTTKIDYQILYVREDGKWYLASVREWPVEKTELEDLAWLIGSWSAKHAQAEVVTNYEWFGNKTFIMAVFSLREKDTTVTGMQLIGNDPATGKLRTWTFEVDGGVGEGSCVRDGKHWIFETSTALKDARVMAARNILTRVDKNTFTWQPVNLEINGEKIADLAPVKVVRVEAKKK